MLRLDFVFPNFLSLMFLVRVGELQGPRGVAAILCFMHVVPDLLIRLVGLRPLGATAPQAPLLASDSWAGLCVHVCDEGPWLLQDTLVTRVRSNCFLTGSFQTILQIRFHYIYLKGCHSFNFKIVAFTTCYNSHSI